MNSREFTLEDGSSSKFWNITLTNDSFEVHFGRIGTDGQRRTKSFSDSVEAEKEYEKVIRQKTKKGYIEVGCSCTYRKK